jgi:hypothetical protein
MSAAVVEQEARHRYCAVFPGCLPGRSAVIFSHFRDLRVHEGLSGAGRGPICHRSADSRDGRPRCFRARSRLPNRQQPDSRFGLRTFGSKLRHDSARHERRRRLYSKRFVRGAIVSELTPALIVLSLRTTKSERSSSRTFYRSLLPNVP